jgi:hypothetical protein
MRFWMSRFLFGAIAIVCLAGHAWDASAQGVEITPFGGYRFGNDFFELVTEQPVDDDGAPAFGVVADVPLGGGRQFEAIYSRQDAYLSTPVTPLVPATRWHITVDHYQAGALQEWRRGDHVRPFLQSTFGLTHYSAEDDDEVRFSLGTGGGVKLFPTRQVGIRLDSRVFITFVDAEAEALACTVGVCLFAADVAVVWQAEFTAGVIIKIRN